MANPSASTSRSLIALVLVAAAIAGSAAICQVWTRLRAIEYGYKISKASQEHMKLLEANRRLRLELALLKNPARIAQLAGEQGLQHPRADQIRRLRLPGSRGVRSPAAPGSPPRSVPSVAQLGRPGEAR